MFVLDNYTPHNLHPMPTFSSGPMQDVMSPLCSKLANGLAQQLHDLRWWIVKVKVATTALSEPPLQRARIRLTKRWLKVGKDGDHG